jgi:anaerobic selenocysteine-containing dehydrogenase
MAVFPNAGKLEQVMREMEFIVVIDQFMTETAQLSHLVLPAAMFLERDELSVNPLNLQHKLLEPDGPMTDWSIWHKLALRMGYAEHFPWQNHEDILRYLLETTGHTLEDLRNNPQGILDQEEVGRFLREGFYTYSGKIELYSMSMETNGYYPLPDYDEPGESPVSRPDIAVQYPLILTTGGRYPLFVHSQHRTINKLRKHAPEPLMQIHPQTAEAFGIKDGDQTVVESPRGAIVIRAIYDAGILPGLVHIPHGWQEANCNRLTDDMARDRISGFPAFKSSLCRVRSF